MLRRKPKITGYRYGTVEVEKVGWRKWRAVVRSPTSGALIDDEYLVDYTETDAKAWAENRWGDLEFLARLQQSLNSGKLSPEDYYRILAKREADRQGCRKNHTHSMQCKYHAH